MEIYYCAGSIKIDSCVFQNNTGNNGGAISTHDTPTEITRSIFIKNYTFERGGAVFNWGSGSDPLRAYFAQTAAEASCRWHFSQRHRHQFWPEVRDCR